MTGIPDETIPEVSVILPTCGRLDSLREAISSVLDQTFRDFEIVLVNDGGTDVSPVLDSISAPNKIVYIQHEQNRGVAAARNTAIKAARGKYLAYLDDDDVYYADHLEALISCLQTGPHKVAYTDSHQEFIEWINDRYVSKGKKKAFGVDFDRQRLLAHNYIPTLNIAHQRNILDHIGLFDEGLETHEDWDLWIRLSRKYDFHHINKITAAFRTFSGPRRSASANRPSISKTMSVIYERYAELVDTPAILEERRRFEHNLSLEVAWNDIPLFIEEYARLHRYGCSAGLVTGKKVLDLGCGDGRGAFLIAQQADSVTGIDPSPDNIRRATSRYGGNNVSFLTGSLGQVPISEDGSFDVVLCFNGLFSTKATQEVLQEVRRLLRPDGLFLSAATNLTFSNKETGWMKEVFWGGLHLDDLRSLLSRQFKNVEIVGQGVFTSSKMTPLGGASGRNEDFLLTKDDTGFLITNTAKEEVNAFFAVSSNGQMGKAVSGSLLVDTTNTLIYRQESIGRELQRDLGEQRIINAQLEDTLEKRDTRIEQLDQTVAQLDSDLVQKNGEVERLQNDINRKTAEFDELESHLRKSISEFKKLESHLKKSISELDQIVQQQEVHIRSLTENLDSIRKSNSWKLLQAYARLKKKLYLIPKSRYRSFIQHVRMEGLSNATRRAWEYLTQGGSRQEAIPGYVRLPEPEVYATWMTRRRPAMPELLEQRQEILGWKDRHLISLIIPVYNTRETWLRELLASICAQTYDHWEALLVDDHSSSPRTLEILKEHVQKDDRFKVVERTQNGGVAAACQDGLEAATGLFASVVDHDDIMEPDALYHIAARLRREPDTDIFYTDESLTDENGNVHNVVFRPGYSYNRLLSHPYIVHLTAFRRSLALSVGGFDLSFQVSQDYDLLLRMAAVTDRFSHIAKVLYRWRQHNESTGHLKIDEVMTNSIRALQRHLALKKIPDAAALAGPSFNFFRVKYPIKEALISIIIPTRDRLDLLRRCVESLKQKTELTSGARYELVIADNESEEDETLTYFRELEKEGHQIVRCEGSFNFSRINNTAARKSHGEILLFLNNDIEIVERGWLMALLELTQQPKTGAVGAKLIYPNGLIQHAGVIIGINQQAAGHSHQFFLEKEHGHLSGGHLGELLCIRECMAVTAACLMVRRDVFDRVEGFDEGFAVGFGDTDLCLRIREKGFANLWTPYARLIHYESASRGKRGDEIHLHPEDLRQLRARWEDVILRGDPYYNPNLSLDSNNFSPAI